MTSKYKWMDLAAFLLTCSVLSTQTNAQRDTALVEGELSVFTVHVPWGLEGDSYYFQTKHANNTKYSQLQFRSKPQNLVSGDKLSLRVRTPTPLMAAFAVQPMQVQPTGMDILEVESFNVTEPSPNKAFSFNSGTIDITSITFLTKICGQVSISDPNAFKARWVNMYNPAAGDDFNTMQNYYKECSFGKARFSGDKNIVVDMTNYDLGCSGTWNGMSWSACACGSAELFGWMDKAKTYVQTALGIDYTQYSRWVMVLPDNNCPWSGLASVGCGRNCMTWFKGAYSMNQFSVPFHELGHNLGLQHATTPGAEYGDGSSTMGGCCGDRCFNAPNSWQVAWAKPIAILNGTTLPVGHWRTFVIPVFTSGNTNHVQIVPTWKGGATTPAYFFSYRQPVGWDRNLLSQYTNSLSVHIFNGSQTVGPYKSELQGTIATGKSLDRADLQFRVRLTKQNTTHATITVCRYSARHETNCVDHLDNDCDGYYDASDSDCIGKIPPSPPPPPSTCNHNGICERPNENNYLCPSDCPPYCGDKLCRPGETAESCPNDCPPVCGDCYCDALRGEKASTCPHDCPKVCGDGYCDLPRGENAANCPSDCGPRCKDGFCDSKRGENVTSCPQDCKPICGDGLCSDPENSMSCRADCPVRCGDRFCDTSANEQVTCSRDCLTVMPPSPQPPNYAKPPSPNPPPCKQYSPPPPRPPPPVARRLSELPLVSSERVPLQRHDHPQQHMGGSETANSMPGTHTLEQNTGVQSQEVVVKEAGIARQLSATAEKAELVKHLNGLGFADHETEEHLTAWAALQDPVLSQEMCGDFKCTGSETAASCPTDCPPACGDGYCDKYRGEDTVTCVRDCPAEWCGDGVCGVSERVETCAADCCPTSHCGDGVCQAYGGENCLTCPQDCAGSKEDGFCCGAYLSCANKQCNTNHITCVHTCID